MSQIAVELKEIRPGVLQLTMQDHLSKNSFSDEIIKGLGNGFRDISGCTSCRVVILTGYGNYFCSGGTRETLTIIHEGRGRFSDGDLYSLALDCDVPVISAMQGHAIGGGFVFGLFADFVVLSRESVYTTNFMRYGFTPGMGATLIVPRKLGTALGHEMLIGARNYRGDDLRRRGCPLPILPRADVLSYAYDLAGEIAEMPRNALVILKRHLTRDLRQQLPIFVEQELAMHELTFHQADVLERIERFYGR